jgi:hypothetical protein
LLEFFFVQEIWFTGKWSKKVISAGRKVSDALARRIFA